MIGVFFEGIILYVPVLSKSYPTAFLLLDFIVIISKKCYAYVFASVCVPSELQYVSGLQNDMKCYETFEQFEINCQLNSCAIVFAPS